MRVPVGDSVRINEGVIVAVTTTGVIVAVTTTGVFVEAAAVAVIWPDATVAATDVWMFCAIAVPVLAVAGVAVPSATAVPVARASAVADDCATLVPVPRVRRSASAVTDSRATRVAVSSVACARAVPVAPGAAVADAAALSRAMIVAAIPVTVICWAAIVWTISRADGPVPVAEAVGRGDTLGRTVDDTTNTFGRGVGVVGSGAIGGRKNTNASPSRTTIPTRASDNATNGEPPSGGETVGGLRWLTMESIGV